MTFGNPVVFYCPSCNRPMKAVTYRSYTVRRGESYSDGRQTGRPHFSPDLAMCPGCKAVFFRHNIWAQKEMDMAEASNIDRVLDPKRTDFVKALEKGLAQNWQEEMQIREYLWRDLNDSLRHGNVYLTEDELEIWEKNSAALIPLVEKTISQTDEKAGNGKRYNLLLISAELRRNLGSFDKCMEIINSLNQDWDWLKEQFEWECKLKNIYTFKLLSKSEMNLEIDNENNCWDYYNRGRIYLMRGKYENALLDLNAAIGLNGSDARMYKLRCVIHETLGSAEASRRDQFKIDIISRNEKPDFWSREVGVDIKTDFSTGVPVIKIRERDGEPAEPEILFRSDGSNFINIIMRRSHCQFIELNTMNHMLIYYFKKFPEIIVSEFKTNELNISYPEGYRDFYKSDILRQYKVKTRPVFEKLEYLPSIIKEGYPLLTGLRARVHERKDLPVREVTGKEDWAALACILAREEDYEQLERYAAEGLPLNEYAPSWFMEFRPTPVFYIACFKVWNSMKEPKKMLRWLIDHGADINKENGNKCTPLRYQYFQDGGYDIMKALLEAGAEPNPEMSTGNKEKMNMDQPDKRCVSCKRPMQENDFFINSTREKFSKEIKTRYPGFSLDLAKCPNCNDAVNYPVFRGLIDRLYANKDKTINELVSGAEDQIILACVLAREEDYFQLERYAAEGLALNEITTSLFRHFEPTPLYYVTCNKIWASMKEPEKMLRWLIDHGADIDMAAGDESTPLGNHCLMDGNLEIVKALLEAGADPNLEIYQDGNYYMPLELASAFEGFETNPNISEEDKDYIKEKYSPQEIENSVKIAVLLREYGAGSAQRGGDDGVSDGVNDGAGNGGFDAGNGSNAEVEEKELRISDEWKEIPPWKFARERTYTSFIIPSGVESVGKCAFAHCRNLRKIDIGPNVSFIGKYAFRKDNRPGEMAMITEVINRSKIPQNIDIYHFHNNDLGKAALFVPPESVEDYKKAEGWKEFGSIMAINDNGAEDKQTALKKTDTAAFHRNEIPSSTHVWICNFGSEEELEEYADNSEYEWEYYGHMLGEDNFDEPPEEYGLNCGFCCEHEMMYEEAADIAADIAWNFLDEDMPPEKILAFLSPFPVDFSEALEICKKKYPDLKKVNSYIVVFGWSNKKQVFEKTESGFKCFYLGEFELPEPDVDGPRDGMV